MRPPINLSALYAMADPDAEMASRLNAYYLGKLIWPGVLFAFQR
jgi:hypothetical protein